MVFRRKRRARLLPARFNPMLQVGDHHDPLVEVHDGKRWIGLLPLAMNQGFEIVQASRPEMDQIAMLSEYRVEYAPDFKVC
jgi:hypothetical protein